MPSSNEPKDSRLEEPSDALARASTKNSDASEMSHPARDFIANEPKASPAQNPRAITWRSILIGFLLIPFFDYWVLDMEVRTSSVEPTDLTLVAPAIVVLFLLVILNGLIKRVFPRIAFSAVEMLVIYSLLMLGVSLSSMNAMPVVIFLMTYGREYATPENGWEAKILPNFPKWLVIDNKKLVNDWYMGYGSFFAPGVFWTWAKPCAYWMLFVSCLILSAYCINAIFLRQWSRSERLTFPVLQLPLAMVGEGERSIFRRPLFWIAFAFAGGINVLNGLASLYPSVPALRTMFITDIGTWFKDPPFNALGWTPINLYPFVIGLGFLMPLDLSFSFVFFYWVWKAERVIGRWCGVDVHYSALLESGYPHYRYQMMGVWIAILAMTIYNARHYLSGVWLTALGKPGGIDDSEEPIRYRYAILGAILGLLGMLVFLMAAGMEFLLAFSYVTILLAMYVAIARIRAELGPPCQDIPASGPDIIATTAYTPQTLGSRNIATLTSLFFLNAEHYRTTPSGSNMETLKIAENYQGISSKHWLAMLFATILGGVIGLFGTIWLGYQFGANVGLYGAPQWYAWQAYTRLDSWYSNPVQTAGPAAPIFGAISFLVSIVMFRLRTIWFGFPLNPIAYAVTGYWTGDHFWFPILISYLCKFLILRYGGLKTYRTALPFFYGLILGEFTIGMGWQIVALILRTSVYTYWR